MCAQEAIALGLLAGFIAWAVNSFFAGVLLSVVDSVYFCYALDRDNQVSSLTVPEASFATSPDSQGWLHNHSRSAPVTESHTGGRAAAMCISTPRLRGSAWVSLLG